MSKFAAVLGVGIGVLAALVLSAFASGCVADETTQPPPGWECHGDGTCSRIAPMDATGDGQDDEGELPAATTPPAPQRVLVMPAVEIVGCVPTDDSRRVVFCDDEGLEVAVARTTASSDRRRGPPTAN